MNKEEQQTIFDDLFSPGALKSSFEEKFSTTKSKGFDKINATTFSSKSEKELKKASEKTHNGKYRFTPYLEILKTKGRDKHPRVIGVPSIRDKVIINQLKEFLMTLYPEVNEGSLANKHIRAISEKITNEGKQWVCHTDIEKFYDSIDREKLISSLKNKVKVPEAINLIQHAIITPTIPQNTPKKFRAKYKPAKGVPQGLAISNILASIYLIEVDEHMKQMEVNYFRYVDDVLMLGSKEQVTEGYQNLRELLEPLGLYLHPEGTEKTKIHRSCEKFAFLGYVFDGNVITVRNDSIDKFTTSISKLFTKAKHDFRRPNETSRKLSLDQRKGIFVQELNERITGAISEKKRYGWISYFSQINDLTLLFKLEKIINSHFKRLHEFSHQAPSGLRSLRKAYWQTKFNPYGGYISNYDIHDTDDKKLKFLKERGQVHGSLSSEEINKMYQAYKHKVLAQMLADESSMY